MLILVMEIYDFNKKLINREIQDKTDQKNYSQNNDIILCNHCKRTASNGIRCLGICVADNDY